jgi:hypothetical protein
VGAAGPGQGCQRCEFEHGTGKGHRWLSFGLSVPVGRKSDSM